MRTLIADDVFAVPTIISVDSVEWMLSTWRITEPRGLPAKVLEVSDAYEFTAHRIVSPHRYCPHCEKDLTSGNLPDDTTRKGRISVRVNSDLHDTNWRLMSE